MRTVISHFYNESYLLPWWLKHHKKMFDYGVMINHGSTDDSVEIIKELAPHWRIVNSALTNFNAYLTDFEVMSYEKELPGWKIALNTTEFLLSTVDLEVAEQFLESEGRIGASCSGYIIVDNLSITNIKDDFSLVSQLNWGFNDNNADIDAEKRIAMNLTSFPARNRFYHKNTVGMYYPGRHTSFHDDSKLRLNDLIIFHYAFSPWNEKMLERKQQIISKLDLDDLKRGWGMQHTKSREQLNSYHSLALSISDDLMKDVRVAKAINNKKYIY